MEKKLSVKCDNCGKFIAHTEFEEDGGATQLYIPPTVLTLEENRVRCTKCTSRKGRPQSLQEVGLELHYKLQAI